MAFKDLRRRPIDMLWTLQSVEDPHQDTRGVDVASATGRPVALTVHFA
jgi:hypothetical protein